MADQNTVQLAYDDRSTGTALVLLHSFPHNRRIWHNQLEALSDQARVIAPDLRGFGQSPLALGPFSIADLADDVYALIQSLGLGKVVLAGLSMGGYVACALAAKHPASLAGIALVDSKAEPDAPEARAGRDKMIAEVEERGLAGLADRLMPKVLAPETLSGRAPVVAAVRAMVDQCPTSTIIHALAAMRDRPDRTAELANLNIPTAVLVGEHDATIPVEVAKKTAESIPGATLHVIPAAGHLAPLENPPDVNRLLLQFVQRCER